MSVNAELDLEIGRFRRKLDMARNDVARASADMKRTAGGVGESFAGGFGTVGRTLGRALPAVGALALVKTAFDQFSKAATYADDLADLTVKLNESADALQRVDFAAKQTGAGGVEAVANAMMRLEKNLGDVENVRAAEALDRYGLSVEKLMALPLDQKVMAFADAFQAARRDGSGYSDLLDLLGKSAGNLVPMLQQSRASLADLFAEAPTAAEETIDRLGQVADRLDALTEKARHARLMVADQLMSFGDLVSRAAKSGGLDEAGDEMLQESIDAQNRATERELARRQQAEAMREAQAAAAQSQAEAAAAEARDEATEKAAKARERLEAGRLKGLPEGARITAMEKKVAEMIGAALKGTGLEGQGKAGVERMVAGLDTDHGRERQTGFVELLADVEEMEREILELKEKQANAAKQEVEARLKESLGLRTLALDLERISERRGQGGAFQATVDRVFGRTPTDFILEESRNQTGLLRSIDRNLAGLKQNRPTGLAPVDVFAYP